MNLKETLEAVRDAVGKCDRRVTEIELMRALDAEAEGWRMRLQELEDEQEDS